MYDAIVVGTRVAGAPTAMLLARRGLKVLAVDRARVPERHALDASGAGAGRRPARPLGPARRGLAAGTPATRRVRFDPGPVVLEGASPAVDGRRRAVQPAPDAARHDARRRRARGRRRGARGLRGRRAAVRGRPGRPASAAARRPRAARGSWSAPTAALAVAKAVGARRLPRQCRRARSRYYTYWAGVPLDGGEMYARERRMIGAWPTNDGLVMTYVARRPTSSTPSAPTRRATSCASLDLAGDLGERVRAGERAERVHGTADLPNRFRVPYGPGWALVGDAGLVMDPITGQGIARRVPRRRAAGGGDRRRRAASATTARAATRRRCRCTR